MVVFAESRRDVSNDDSDGEKNSLSAEHVIYEENTKFIVEEDGSDEEKEDGHGKYQMSGLIPVFELEAGIIQGREHEFVVNMANVREPTSPLTNMWILDKEHAIEIYA